MARGFSVRIFVPSGDPEGLKIVEKSNWVGLGLVFPRTQYAEVRKRTELRRPGVYILWGTDEKKHLPRVYIGEGEVVLSRLDHHIKQKDFWTHAVVFISKDSNFNKAHVRYLESRLIYYAKKANLAKLENSNEPSHPPLSEADAADAEAFLHEIFLLLPIVGVTFFERKSKQSRKKIRHKIRNKRSQLGNEHTHKAVTHSNSDHENTELYLRNKGVEAKGILTPEGLMVLKDSKATKDEVPSIKPHTLRKRRILIEKGILRDEGKFFRFTQNYTFKSPSAAASVILGRETNGREAWKDSHGRTLKQIQEHGKDISS